MGKEEKEDVKTGDIVLQMNGKQLSQIKSRKRLRKVIRKHETLNLTLLRKISKDSPANKFPIQEKTLQEKITEMCSLIYFSSLQGRREDIGFDQCDD